MQDNLNKPLLTLLLVEDSEDDAMLLVRHMSDEYSVSHQRVDSENDLKAALTAQKWDIVLSDYTMPGFSGTQALNIVREKHRDLPFIFVSGTIGEDKAVAAMRAGAQDYIMKNNLIRLLPLVDRELREAIIRREKRNQELLFSEIVDAAADSIIAINEQHQIISYNTCAEIMFGYLRQDALGSNVNILLPPEQNNRLMKQIDSMNGSEIGRTFIDDSEQIYCRHKDNREFPVEISLARVALDGFTVFTLIIRNISERKLFERQLKKIAEMDELTGLYNRRMFGSRLDLTMQLATRNGTMLALLMIDLDRFKFVNDSLGHQAGDEVLKQSAKRIKDISRDCDTVARLGGDEFAIVLSEITALQQVEAFSERLIKAFEKPFIINNRTLKVYATVGIALFPEDGITNKQLMRNADYALYRAKDLGGNRYTHYQKDMLEFNNDRYSIITDARSAISNQEFQLHYQPQVDLKTGLVTGVEVLLRWLHPRMGFIAPDRFIPLFEDTGVINDVGKWVFRTACLQAAAWRSAGIVLKVAINFSARQLQEEGLVQNILAVLKETGAKPEWLEIEITESALMSSPDLDAGTVLKLLKQEGFSISLDDFGTGLSSLTYLKRFPVNILKIDQCLITEVPGEPESVAIIRAILAMAKELNFGVLAEAVETQEQHEFLLGAGCDLVQGHYFHNPMPADSITTLMVEQNNSGIRLKSTNVNLD